MHLFPGEERRSVEAQKNIEHLLNVAEALHNFWLDHPKDMWLERSTLPHRVVNLAAVLDVQASRQFRSVIEECRRCEASNANIVARSLFETVLAIRFVLAKKQLRMAIEQTKDKVGAPKFTSSG